MTDPLKRRAGEYGYFPGVVAKVDNAYRAQMARVGTTCLRSEWPKPWLTTNVETNQRRCRICNHWLSAEAFHRNRKDPLLGREHQCATCEADDRRGRRAA